ncbi:hypothetical protein V1477_019886 [Vespula maculifrons]|uniref:Uncharacterized protein n=1 Tax=Vespula maculifrons TaxID=7453 RepID=A0ABD2AKD4_VESMC
MTHRFAKFVSIARQERCILFILDLILDATVPTSAAATNCFLYYKNIYISSNHIMDLLASSLLNQLAHFQKKNTRKQMDYTNHIPRDFLVHDLNLHLSVLVLLVRKICRLDDQMDAMISSNSSNDF